MSTPSFSIITPTFNRANLIGRAVRTVLAQTFSDFELLIVDDGSTDSTREVVANLDDQRIRYIYQANQGTSAARNAGAALAKGKYLTFLDSDDEALPFWLEAHAAQYAANETVAIVCSGCRYSSGYINRPKDLGPLFAHQVGLFQAGTFTVQRELFEKAGGYAEDLRQGENTELGMRLVKLCTANGKTIANLAMPLTLYHNLSESGKVKERRFAERLEAAEYMSQAYPDLLQEMPGELTKQYEIAGVNAARIGKGRTARHYLLRAIRLNPKRLKNYARLVVTLLPYFVHNFWVQRRWRRWVYRARMQTLKKEG